MNNKKHVLMVEGGGFQYGECPMRPPSVPDEAVWNAEESEWELGDKRDGTPVGDWTWWRSDGTRVCQSHFDKAGQLHGDCRRYHPSGDLSYAATCAHGKKHGKEIVCRSTTGETTEVGALSLPEINPDLYRMETLWVRGEMRATTLYNRIGLLAPIETTAHGHVEELGQHLQKLLSGTFLSLTTPFLLTMGSVPQSSVDAMQQGRATHGGLILPPKIPSSMVNEARYVCPAVKGGTTHRIGIIDHQGQAHLAIIDVGAIGRSLTLTVDLLLHDLVNTRRNQ